MAHIWHYPPSPGTRGNSFVNETGFEDFTRSHGRSPLNYPPPSLAPKVKPDKTSVIGVVYSDHSILECYNLFSGVELSMRSFFVIIGFHGLVQAIPFVANYTAAIFEQAMEHIVLPVLPHNCYLVKGNASIHNDDHLAQILAQKNITLVKLPPYSYDLNPIKMVFGLAKAYSLRHKDIDNKAVQILSAFSDVSAMAIQNFNCCSWRIQC